MNVPQGRNEKFQNVRGVNLSLAGPDNLT